MTKHSQEICNSYISDSIHNFYKGTKFKQHYKTKKFLQTGGLCVQILKIHHLIHWQYQGLRPQYKITIENSDRDSDQVL